MLKRVLDPCSIIRVQSWDIEAIVPSTVEDILGVAWPQQTGTVASGPASVICVGPTDWLIVAADRDAAPWLQRLEQLFQGSSFRATDVSQALTSIEIGSSVSRDLLAKACSLDLHPPLFPPGRSARTRFAGMPVIVRCTGTSKFELVVAQSYADYLLCWLTDAAIEFSNPQPA